MKRARVLCLVVALAAGLMVVPVAGAGQSEQEQEEDNMVIRLEHIDTQSAVTMLRAILQVRQIAEFPPTRTIVIRDEPVVMAQAVVLIREVDLPLPRWRLELALGETVLRRIDLENESLEMGFGSSDASHIRLMLESRPSGNDLKVSYRFVVHLAGTAGTAPLVFSEAGTATIGDGDRLQVVAPDRGDHCDQLEAVLGLGDAGCDLVLRFAGDPTPDD